MSKLSKLRKLETPGTGPVTFVVDGRLPEGHGYDDSREDFQCNECEDDETETSHVLAGFFSHLSLQDVELLRVARVWSYIGETNNMFLRVSDTFFANSLGTCELI